MTWADLVPAAVSYRDIINLNPPFSQKSGGKRLPVPALSKKKEQKRPRILGETQTERKRGGRREGGVDGWMDGWRLAGAVSLISLLSLLIHPGRADSSLPSRTLHACQVIHIPYLHSRQHLRHHHRHKETDMQGGEWRRRRGKGGFRSATQNEGERDERKGSIWTAACNNEDVG